MTRQAMLQVLGPVAAVAVLAALVAVLLSVGGTSGPTPPTARGPGGTVALDDAGMSDGLPPPDGPEWKPHPSGIKIWDVAEGTGPECPPGARVVMHYTGWLTDGTVFDSSRRTGQPLDYPLGSLIKGWQEGIPGMRPGGIRRLLIPPELGYGSRGQGQIPPDATLVFEVKLLQAK